MCALPGSGGNLTFAIGESMGAIRLIPPDDEVAFPYEEALRRLAAFPGVTMRPKDFGPLIAAGAKVGWPTEMLEEHERLAERGLCFDFVQNQVPFLQGSLYE